MAARKTTGAKPAPASIEASAALRAWLDANQRAPLLWRQVAERLLAFDEIGAVWREIGKHGILSIHLFTMARMACERAIIEFGRAPVDDEQAAIDRVRDLAAQLKAAIEQAPLPAGRAYARQLEGSRLPPIELFIGWRDLDPSNPLWVGAYPLAIVDVLDQVPDLIDAHVRSMPRRTVERRRDTRARADRIAAAEAERARMFVRSLADSLNKDHGVILKGTIARIANAVLLPAEPLDKSRVDAILKDSSRGPRKVARETR